MMISMKNTLFTLLLTSALCSNSLFASDPTADPTIDVATPTVSATPVVEPAQPDPAAADPTSAPVTPAMEPVEPNPTPVPGQPALVMTLDDQTMIMNLIILLQGVQNQVKDARDNGNPNPDVAKIIETVFTQGGLGDQTVNLLDALINRINGLVQTSTNPKMTNCKACCAGFAKGTKVSAEQLHKLLPLVDKYYNFFDDGINKYHWAPEEIATNLIKYGLLSDLHGLLKVSKKHIRNMNLDAEERQLKAARAALKAARRRGDSAPVVKVDEDKGKEEATK